MASSIFPPAPTSRFAASRRQPSRALLAALAALGLLDADPQAEARRNILVAPFWTDGDETSTSPASSKRRCAGAVSRLPGKFGFAVDCGAERVLAAPRPTFASSAAATAGLIVRPDGAERGRPVSRDEAAGVAIALAEWFVGLRRYAAMAGAAWPPISRKGAEVPDRLAATPPARAASPRRRRRDCIAGRRAGRTGRSGRCAPQTLARARRLGHELRLTPWRMVLI